MEDKKKEDLNDEFINPEDGSDDPKNPAGEDDQVDKKILAAKEAAATVAAALQRIKRSAITLALKPKDAVLLAMAARQRSPKRARGRSLTLRMRAQTALGCGRRRRKNIPRSTTLVGSSAAATRSASCRPR